MSTEKKQNETLAEQLSALLPDAWTAVQTSESGQSAADTNRYSTAGLNSRADVQSALAAAQYTPSQSVTDAAAQLAQVQQNRPAAYQSAYQSDIDALLDELLGRESFQYSYLQDPLYRQYAQVYTQNAQNASADAAAQAAALTGGYGSSYAVSAAQQAYQQQLGMLDQILPTLYSLALDTYNSGGDALVTGLDQLTAQEKNAQTLYNNALSDYYTQLEQTGEAYNTAYAQDYSQYQDYLSRLDSLYSNYTAQDQESATKRQQVFNNVMSVLGLIGDAVQLYFTGTAGLGSMASSLLNTGYNIYASNREYEDSRADTAWEQQMAELQRQDSLTQQQYKNQQSEREYQDALAQQQFDNDVTSQKLSIAKGEWALKQAAAQQTAARASANTAAKSSGSRSTATSGTSSSSSNKSSTSSSTGSVSGTSGLNVGWSGTSSQTLVPYTAARLRSLGRSDSTIRTALLQEGYSSEEIRSILKQLNG